MGIESALLGNALFTTAGGVGVGTTGLLGAGGSLGLGGSLFTGSGLSSVFGGLSAISSVVGGAQQNSAAKEQAAYTQATANLQAKEAARTASLQAGIESREAESVRRAQKVAYLKSGVDLSGSPLLLMEATRQQGRANVDEILQGGAYSATSSSTEGRRVASNYRDTGRRAFTSGLVSGISQARKLF